DVRSGGGHEDMEEKIKTLCAVLQKAWSENSMRGFDVRESLRGARKNRDDERETMEKMSMRERERNDEKERRGEGKSLRIARRKTRSGELKREGLSLVDEKWIIGGMMRWVLGEEK
ncbi:hypothetical protein Tco_1514214, partial [Tanacetum coccineum]